MIRVFRDTEEPIPETQKNMHILSPYTYTCVHMYKHRFYGISADECGVERLKSAGQMDRVDTSVVVRSQEAGFFLF